MQREWQITYLINSYFKAVQLVNHFEKLGYINSIIIPTDFVPDFYVENS